LALISGKEEVKDGDHAIWMKKYNLPEVTQSWHSYMIKEMVQDFQATVLQVRTSKHFQTVNYG